MVDIGLNMVNAINGLKFIKNTVMTVAKHPTGVPKYGQAHKELVSIYEGLFGGSKAIKGFKAGKLSEEAGWGIYEKLMNRLQSNKWIGANIEKQVGKHKIPRYLYHVTTRPNYESMLKTGTLRVSDPGGLGSGVYMFELQNMINHYGNHNGYRGLERLLEQASLHGGDELVLLRIPTSKLNASRLAIRDNGAPINLIPSQFNVTNFIGDSAVSSKLYKQRKVGLEYIYPHDININNVSEIGSAKIKPLIEGNMISDTEALSVWKALTARKAENRAFEALG